MKTRKNYESVTKPITIFDACISGNTDIVIFDTSQKYGAIISRLIDAEISGATEQIDDYIIDTFHTGHQDKYSVED